MIVAPNLLCNEEISVLICTRSFASRLESDSSLRKLITEFSIERARIMDKEERPNKEASVNYWKKKYYQKAEELKKLKKTCAA